MARQERGFTISELSREFGVTPRALRFYEDRGLLAPARVGLNRIYAPRDRARLKLILIGKRIGLALGDIRELLDLYDIGDGQRTQMQATLEALKAREPELEAQRRDLDAALEVLRDKIAWLEARLADPGNDTEGGESLPLERAS